MSFKDFAIAVAGPEAERVASGRRQARTMEALGTYLGQGADAGLADIYKQSPQAGMQAEQQTRQRQQQRLQALQQRASFLVQMPPEQRAAAWPSVKASMQSVDPELFAALPDAYDPAIFDPVLQQIAGVGGPEAPKVVGAGGALVGNDGRVLFQNDFRPDAPKAAQFVQVPDGRGGMVSAIFDPNTQSVRPIGGGMQPQTAPPVNSGGDPQMDALAQAANAMIKAGVPPEQVDAFLMQAAQASPQVQVNPPTMQPTSNPQAAPQPQGGGFGYTPPKADPQAVTLTPQEVTGLGLPAGTVAQRKPDGTISVVSRPDAAGANKSAEQEKVDIGAAGLAAEAQAFAASFTGVSVDDIKKMTPAQVRDLVNGKSVTLGDQQYRAKDRFFTGPILGRVPFADQVANPDLVAYQNAAAGRQARINNPTGPVSNADFEIAAKSTFSPDKPKSVNADLIYKALTSGSSGSAPQAPAASQLSDEELMKALNL